MAPTCASARYDETTSADGVIRAGVWIGCEAERAAIEANDARFDMDRLLLRLFSDAELELELGANDTIDALLRSVFRLLVEMDDSDAVLLLLLLPLLAVEAVSVGEMPAAEAPSFLLVKWYHSVMSLSVWSPSTWRMKPHLTMARPSSTASLRDCACVFCTSHVTASLPTKQLLYTVKKYRRSLTEMPVAIRSTIACRLSISGCCRIYMVSYRASEPASQQRAH